MAALLITAALAAAAGWAARALLARPALRAARSDPLTGLPARAAWTAQAQRLLRHGDGTVAFIDLDRFKEVNDTYGHAAGDHLLAVAAARIRAWAAGAGGGACGRLGGDEFAVVTRGPVTAPQVAALADALAAPVALPGGAVVPAAASVGAAPAARDGLSAALAAADCAMYEARRGGSRWRLAAPGGAPAPGTAPVRRARHHGPPRPPARAAAAGEHGGSRPS